MKRKPAKTSKGKRPVGRPRKKDGLAKAVDALTRKSRRRRAAKSAPPKPVTALASSFPGAFTLAKQPGHHPMSGLLPGQSDAEREAMRQSLITSGQIDPIILLTDDEGDGILDGRHRDELLRELGIEPVYVDFDPTWGSPLDYVVSKGFAHRNMTDTQKACAAVEILPRLEANAAKRMKAGKADPTEPVPEGGKKLVSAKTRAQMRALLTQNGRKELDRKYRLHVWGQGDDSTQEVWGTTDERIDDILDRMYGPEVEAPKGESREQAGQLFGVSGRYVSMAKLLKAEAPDLFKLAFDGDPKHPLTVATRVLRDRKKTAEMKDKAAAAKSDPAHGEGWTVVTGDCVKELPKLDVVARLIFADPPYNEGINYGPGVNDRLSAPKYLDWCAQWIGECYDRLAEDGSLFLMISTRYQAEFWDICRRLGLHFRQTIVNVETFGTHQEGNFTNCTRFIHYWTKHANRYAWNAGEILIPSDRQAKYDDKRAKEKGKVPGNVWEYPRLVGTATARHPGFPTQLPRAMLDRIVRVASDPGDVVLDPFGGSGTTTESAIANGRVGVTIEKIPENAEFIRLRAAAAVADHKKGQQKGPEKGAAA